MFSVPFENVHTVPLRCVLGTFISAWWFLTRHRATTAATPGPRSAPVTTLCQPRSAKHHHLGVNPVESITGYPPRTSPGPDTWSAKALSPANGSSDAGGGSTHSWTPSIATWPRQCHQTRFALRPSAIYSIWIISSSYHGPPSTRWIIRQRV